MKISGNGEVFLADTAQDVHLFYLQDDRITVIGRNVLAFDAGIDWYSSGSRASAAEVEIRAQRHCFSR